MNKEIQAVAVRNELFDKRHALASIFTLINKCIGVLILSDACLDGRGIEIYAMSIVKKYQNQGYGSQLLGHLLNYAVYEDIYARCSPTSHKMRQLLFSRGFKLDLISEG